MPNYPNILHPPTSLYNSRQLPNMAAPSIAKRSCFRAVSQFNRIFAAPATSKASFTTSSAQLTQLRASFAPRASLPSIPSSIASARIAAQCNPQTIRNASTASQPSKSAPATSAPEILTWNRFFDLRRKRRFINLGASIVTAVITVGVAAPIIANQDIDTWGAQISGMDPFVVLGVTTFTVAIAGWMCGPTFGTAGFKLWAGRRGWNTAIAQVGGEQERITGEAYLLTTHTEGEELLRTHQALPR
jgi:import inner membrane translocase subunit TIM23